VTLPRRLRSAGLALVSAALVLLVFTIFADNPLIRGLETASLDLRFRVRGVRPPGSEVAVILVDDRSLEALGRWPFSRARNTRPGRRKGRRLRFSLHRARRTRSCRAA